ncbi:MAG: helicase C-terminal domain-containing protein [Myxococcota bacterium]
MSGAASLWTHHAFVDLETTGLDPSRDEVIELGVLFVERGEVTGRLSKLFRASRPLPLAIRRLTGIRDEDLREAPAFASFRQELQAALRGWTVVAHNAAFEESFLAEVLVPLRAPVLDSCELLHYLYPELDSHSLEAAVRWANVGEAAAHRALQDCEDTFAVLRFALDKCVSEARADDLRDLLAVLDPAPSQPLLGAQREAALVELLRGLHALCVQAPSTLTLTPSTPFLPARPERERLSPAATPLSEGVRPVFDAELESLLGAGGALERTSAGFTPRPEQLSMAREVAQAFNRGETLAVEAGTGTGKSLAYLAPAALFAARNGIKVAVAPHTRTLQDQLVEKDLPKLHQATAGAFGYAVLKGQNNYLCRRRALELTSTQGAKELPHEERAPRAYLRAFLRRSADGDLDRLSYWFRGRYPGLARLAAATRSEAAATLGPRCPHYQRCYYHSAVAQAKAADLLVVNQSLALAWPERYPEVRHIVVDEAHELEDTATSAYSAELTEELLAQLEARLLRLRLAKETPLAAASRALVESRERLTLAVGEVFPPGPYGGERRLDASPTFEPLRRELLFLRSALRALGSALKELSPTLPSQSHQEREVASALAALEEHATFVEELTERPHPARCYQVGWRDGGFALVAQPIEVAGLLQEGFTAGKRSLVLTSATLSTGGERPFALARVGLGRARLVKALSPFDVEKGALVVLVTDAPDPNDDGFAEWAAARISGLAAFMGGRLLGLFASARRLDAVAQRVQSVLEPLGIEVLRQFHGNARSLAQRQEQDFGSVLLGTKSFWQGVDIPGPGVTCVFIDKLPIEPKARPLVAAREERLAEAATSGFARYRLPRALLLLRQGVGRLLRSANDRGVVIIADPGSEAYRQKVFDALEGYRVEALAWAQARLRIREELQKMGAVKTPSRARAPAQAELFPGLVAG